MFSFFFQRSALAIAANCCLNLKPTDAALLPQAVQSLSDRLQSTVRNAVLSLDPSCRTVSLCGFFMDFHAVVSAKQSRYNGL